MKQKLKIIEIRDRQKGSNVHQSNLHDEVLAT